MQTEAAFHIAYLESMDKRLLDILCCPSTHQPLRFLTRGELELLNKAVSGRDLIHADGSACLERVSAALMTRDCSRIYRIEDDIPVMLADLSIATNSIEGMSAANG
ncbi:MAG: Trm112 family protein [Dokdonella sp.]